MKVFANAGIYTLIDLDTFSTYILPVRNARLTRKASPSSRKRAAAAGPEPPELGSFANMIAFKNDPSWNQTQFDAYAKVMDNFAEYDNVLGFFIGNEIIAKNGPIGGRSLHQGCYS